MQLSDGYFSMLNMPDAKERRRYALLQAAAAIRAASHVNTGISSCVEDAELLLAEIEKREEAK